MAKRRVKVDVAKAQADVAAARADVAQAKEDQAREAADQAAAARAERIAQIREFAQAHYNQGWDAVVEAWGDEAILEAIEDTGNLKDAVNAVADVLSLHREAALNARWGEDSDPELKLPKPARAGARTDAQTPEAKEPVWVEQKGYKGEVERIDQNLHAHKFTCDCGEVRWVAPGDLFQVDACKPCVEARRKEKRNARAKARRARKAEAKANAKAGA